MALDVYAVRGDEDYIRAIPEILSKEDYSHMSNEQFILFAKVYLKDNIMKPSGVNSWQHSISYDNMVAMNRFFESIPEELIDFSSDITKRLILKYITSNLKFGFGIDLNNDSRANIYNMIHRLSEIDPRLGSIK